ncbi:MAG: sodium:proton antiporter [Gammaproteobacteria bacterium]|nr:sodium:proton antiporter [Gammaproteobacteria bacterium]
MNLLLFITATLVMGIALEGVFARLRIPWSAGLVVVGFVASEVVTGLGGDIGLRWDAVHDIVFFVLLPVLVFEAALNLDVGQLKRHLPMILVLAVPLLLVSTAVIALLLRSAIGPGFPWMAALFAGAILSATDPVAVLALFRKMGVSPRLAVLMDGESLFNDATAIVLAALLLGIAAGAGAPVSVAAATLEFLRVFAGGLAVGALVGGLLVVLFRVTEEPPARVGLTVSGAFLAFALAEGVLHLSGVMAVLAAGLCAAVGLNARREVSRLAHQSWEVMAYLANGAVFLLMGATITVAMFSDRWLAMLMGIGAALVARGAVVFAGIPLANLLPGVEPVPAAFRPILYWGGLRGAITIALALSIPLEHPWWYTVQAIAYGVVLFTLFVQAPTMPLLLRRTRGLV